MQKITLPTAWSRCGVNQVMAVRFGGDYDSERPSVQAQSKRQPEELLPGGR